MSECIKNHTHTHTFRYDVELYKYNYNIQRATIALNKYLRVVLISEN